jgi:DNA (cytosine-5)-methyltransferase 1
VPLTFGSLFTGAGGIDLGIEKAGWQCKFQVEWDEHCSQTLAYHWPTVPRWRDVSGVMGSRLPAADLVTFGSPCQDLSIAGKRAGMAGGRSSLFYEASRVIREMRHETGNKSPRWVLWENVPGALRSNGGRDFGAVLDELADIGALAIEWHLLDARFFAVPQRRRRLFVLACLDPAAHSRGARAVLPVATSGGGDLAQGQQAQPADTDTGEGGTAAPSTEASQVAAVWAFDSTMSNMTQFHNDIAPTLKVGSGLKIPSPPAVYRTGEPMRRLTPLECERLQGYPDGHTARRIDGLTNNDAIRYRMCGNGVAAPVAAWIGEHIAIADKEMRAAVNEL